MGLGWVWGLGLVGWVWSCFGGLVAFWVLGFCGFRVGFCFLGGCDGLAVCIVFGFLWFFKFGGLVCCLLCWVLWVDGFSDFCFCCGIGLFGVCCFDVGWDLLRFVWGVRFGCLMWVCVLILGLMLVVVFRVLVVLFVVSWVL